MTTTLRVVVVLCLLLGVACLPGAITHYAVSLTPVAVCDISMGTQNCQEPVDGGVFVGGTMSVDEREDTTRVFFRQDTLVGKLDGRGHLTAEVVRDAVREQSGCRTRQHTKLDGLHDDPGFGLRQQIRGSYEESSTAEGDPQQCGRNVPYGTLTRYRLDAVETSQP